MFPRAATLTLTFLFPGPLSLAAADRAAPAAGPTALAGAVASAAKDGKDAAPVTLWTLSQHPKRPLALPVLYGTYGLLQAMNIMSTKKALRAGAKEATPLMRKGNMGTTLAIKAASGVATVYVVEKMWKKNRIGPIALMTAVNGVTAAVVAHNLRNGAR